jgi:hypothetical protein
VSDLHYYHHESASMDDAIKRVRELHKMIEPHGLQVCEACSTIATAAAGSDYWVAYSLCPTIRALDGDE